MVGRQTNASLLHPSALGVAAQQAAAEGPEAKGREALRRGQAAQDGGGVFAAQLEAGALPPLLRATQDCGRGK